MKTLSLCLLAAALVTSLSAETLRFTGKIVTADNQPVPGAAVEFYQLMELRDNLGALSLKKRVVSNSDGVVEAELERAVLMVVFSRPPLAPAWINLIRETGRHERTIVMPSPTNLVGVAVDVSGQPVGNAEVWVSAAITLNEVEGAEPTEAALVGKAAREAFSTRSSADGRFEIAGFPPNAAALFAGRAHGLVLRERGLAEREFETMHRPGGQIELTFEKTGAVEGAVVIEDTGERLARAALFLGEPGEPVLSGDDGEFRIEAAEGSYLLRAFCTNDPPGWIARAALVEVKSGQLASVGVQATRGGLLEARVVDERGDPVAGASISARNKHEADQGADLISPESGMALMRLLPGEYQVNAQMSDAPGPRNAEEMVARIEAHTTNRITLKFKERRWIDVKVTGHPDGKPVAGVAPFYVPLGGEAADLRPKSEPGQYEFSWRHGFSAGGGQFSLVASCPERNLAAIEPISEDGHAIELRLRPGLRINGRVADTTDRPLTNAIIRVALQPAPVRFGIEPKIEADGRFKISGLPAGRQYRVDISAEGHGIVSYQIREADAAETNLPDTVLREADREVAGLVIDDQERPLPGAHVKLSGNGQPESFTRTDSDGRFSLRVCDGRFWLSADYYERDSKRLISGVATSMSGDTNIVIQLGVRNLNMGAEVKAPRTSLRGKALPDLKAFGLSKDLCASRSGLVLCLVDIEQRPSRVFLRVLSEHHSALQQRNLALCAVQAAVIPREALEQWTAANRCPFPVGAVAAQDDAVRWATKVEKLPWLILTDASGRVAAEGLEVDELDDRIVKMMDR
jgi:hypothetical protein